MKEVSAVPEDTLEVVFYSVHTHTHTRSIYLLIDKEEKEIKKKEERQMREEKKQTKENDSLTKLLGSLTAFVSLMSGLGKPCPVCVCLPSSVTRCII